MKVRACPFNIAAVKEKLLVRDGDVIRVTQKMMVDHEIGARDAAADPSQVPRRKFREL